MARDNDKPEEMKKEAGSTDSTIEPDNLYSLTADEAKQMLDIRESGEIGMETEVVRVVEDGRPYYAPDEDPVRKPERELQEVPNTGDPAFNGMVTPDDYLEQIVRFALDESDRVNTEKIEVSGRNGVIYLRGRVGSLEEADGAEEIAVEQEGVREVINELVW